MNVYFKAKRIDNGEWVEGYFTKKKIGSLFVPVIEVIKECDSGDYIESYEIDGNTLKDAIDTVVQELERTIPTLKQSDDKRMLFSAYMQGKRDQIYFATKWEELAQIGKYRIIKQFLAWHQTLKLKEETK